MDQQSNRVLVSVTDSAAAPYAERMMSLLSTELAATERLEKSLSAIEDIILGDPAELRKKSDEELMEIYQTLAARKDTAMKFVAKLAELGIKAKFLRDDLTPKGQEARVIEALPPNMTPRARQIRAKLQEELERAVRQPPIPV